MKILLISISPLFIIAGLAALMQKPTESLVAGTTSYAYDYSAYENMEFTSRLPVLKSTDSYPVLSAQGVYAYDMTSGVALYEKSPDTKLFPASTTKMLTALVAMDIYELDKVLNTGTVRVGGASMGLANFEEISVRELLYGVLVHSGNDAAEVLASNAPGGRTEFIKLMNLKAREINALDSRFLNPTGLDEIGQETTARDLARIAAYAMKDELFAEIVSTESYAATNSAGTAVHYLTNRNKLLGVVDGVLGVKTGWTESARENLVTYVERDGNKVLISILGSQDRFGETKELIDWIFNSYNWELVSYSPGASYSP